MASHLIEYLPNVVRHLNYADTFRALLIFLVGYLLAKMARLFIARILGARLNSGDLMTIQRITFYTIFILFLISALRQIGFNLAVLLGAAGIFTVAFGFASQTSVSNLISGLFLLVERPFLVGDTIQTNNVTGKVLSIDLLSTKIIMDDNTYVRIPNELLIKSQIANLSRFKIKRINLILTISPNAELEQVKSILFDIINGNSFALADPNPAINFIGLYDYGVKIEIFVWCNLKESTPLKNTLIEVIKLRFKESNIRLTSDFFAQKIMCESVKE